MIDIDEINIAGNTAGKETAARLARDLTREIVYYTPIGWKDRKEKFNYVQEIFK